MIAKLRKRFILLTSILIYSFTMVAQEELSFELKWTNPIDYGLEGTQSNKLLNFEFAQYDFSKSNIPYYISDLNKNNSSYLTSAIIQNPVFEKLSPDEQVLVEDKAIDTEIAVEVIHSTIRKRNHNSVKIIPLRKNAFGEVEKLVSFDLKLDYSTYQSSARNKTQTYASNSKLSSGEWYKIAVTKDAVYKLNYTFLDKLGLDLESINPKNIQLYGYGGGMLPELNSAIRPDDMQENAIIVVGEQDGVFNKSDYILFYGEDQVAWKFDQAKNAFRHTVNLYSDTTSYFIHVGSSPGKRISKETRPSDVPQYVTSGFNDYAYHEQDMTNLLKSGKTWLGELFDNQLNYTFDFNLPNIDQSQKGVIELSVFARSAVKSNFITSVNGQSFTTQVGSVNLNRYEFSYASGSRSFFDFTPGQGIVDINLRYDKPQSVSRGWLNSLTVNVRRKLILQSGQIIFRDINSVGHDFSEFLIQSAKNIRIWDITNKYSIVEKEVLKTGSSNSIISSSLLLKEFVAFESYDTSHVFANGRVSNQNLHGMPLADLVIVTHRKFSEEANRLANFHRNEGLAVNVVTPQQIYNEFSSGSPDLIAIRSYIKMIYDRSSSPKDLIRYVVILGDASYDYKDRINGNTNMVPAYQSSNSMDPVNSYVSDDYFGLLDDSEGEWKVNSEKLDVAIGRIPAQSKSDAAGVVDKIIRYASPSSLRDWRNEIVFVADDEDSFTHITQSNNLSKIVDLKGPDFNTKKIFLDAYQQQSSASGDRYPDANRAINEAVQNGALILNYTGHGGETGWTSERVVGVSDITSWTNINNMPVFITASCEFSRFDDPLRISGGEMTILNPKGGGIGLMTTTRLVFSSPNYLLNRSFYDNVFLRDSEGRIKRLGDVFVEVKNINAYSPNSRNFSLLGDPAVQLAIPDYNVVTSTVNGKPVNQSDTINALSTVDVTGFVEDHNGVLMNAFNGIIYATVFDKVIDKKTLDNDGFGVFKYQERDRRLFKGKASVVNGKFSFSFVVPKDISYNFGEGKISYYTENGVDDGNGYSTDIIIGGSNPNYVDDKIGPEMSLYMNDKSFVYGGVTDNKPILMVDLSDSLGINTVGSGIGHDLIAVLDGNTEKTFVLNDYYEAEINNYSKGKVTFPFTDLAEGKHTLRVKAWDVANNSSEKSIEFNVVESKDVKIENLVNYPNPFTTSTEFIFQHNQAGVPMDIKLEIFTVSGKLVKSFDQVIVNSGFISRDIKWNGRDDYGDKIGKGVYVYKIKVRSRNGSTSEKFEKLVIL